VLDRRIIEQAPARTRGVELQHVLVVECHATDHAAPIEGQEEMAVARVEVGTVEIHVLRDTLGRAIEE
jgi:hypothetical protein